MPVKRLAGAALALAGATILSSCSTGAEAYVTISRDGHELVGHVEACSGGVAEELVLTHASDSDAEALARWAIAPGEQAAVPLGTIDELSELIGSGRATLIAVGISPADEPTFSADAIRTLSEGDFLVWDDGGSRALSAEAYGQLLARYC